MARVEKRSTSRIKSVGLEDFVMGLAPFSPFGDVAAAASASAEPISDGSTRPFSRSRPLVKSSDLHNSISKGHHDDEGDETAGETTGWQTHSGTAHENTAHDEEVGVRLVHGSTDIEDKREEDQSSDSMADEGCNDQDQSREDNQDTIQTHAFHFFRDDLGKSVQKTRRSNSFTQGQSTGSEDDNGPWEVVEVLLSQQTNTKEENNRDNGNDAHISKLGL
ncbi:hypothetical protein HG531_000319 [Fusarium graminearum]|nr:hypothetical protein HG531_000319 [Fusarium graminearum]